MQEFWVGRDLDRFGEHLGRGIAPAFFKVSLEEFICRYASRSDRGVLPSTAQCGCEAPQDPAYYRAYGIELVGPPLAIE